MWPTLFKANKNSFGSDLEYYKCKKVDSLSVTALGCRGLSVDIHLRGLHRLLFKTNFSNRMECTWH